MRCSLPTVKYPTVKDPSAESAGVDSRYVAATITLASLDGLNSASEMQRLLLILISSLSVATKAAICKALALLHSWTLSKDSTGIHSERGLLGSEGGNTSNRLLAGLNGSTSDAPCFERPELSSVFLCSPVEETDGCTSTVSGVSPVRRDSGWWEIRIVPLAFFVLLLVKLLSQSTLGEQDCQENKNELFSHNSRNQSFARTLYLLPTAGGSGAVARGSGATIPCPRGPLLGRGRGPIVGTVTTPAKQQGWYI